MCIRDRHTRTKYLVAADTKHVKIQELGNALEGRRYKTYVKIQELGNVLGSRTKHLGAADTKHTLKSKN